MVSTNIYTKGFVRVNKYLYGYKKNGRKTRRTQGKSEILIIFVILYLAQISVLDLLTVV
jgi:hypothetical protein